MKILIKKPRKKPVEIEQSYRSLVESIKDYAIFMLDEKGNITSWDQGASKMFGYKKEEVLGKNYSILFTKSDVRNKAPQADLASAAKEGRHLDERQYVAKNKRKFWSSGVLTSNKSDRSSRQVFSKIMRDVTQQKDLHQAAIHNSMHDFLTGLPNRNCFKRELMDSMAEVKKKGGGSLLALLYLDFNNFKRTNDEMGHKFGDLVLIEIAHRLSKNIRTSDMAARFGGDEFMILAKGVTSRADTAFFSQKIINAFREPIRIGRKVIKTSVSIGIVLYPIDTKRADHLLRFSDQALYQAKKLGGNQYQFYK